VELKLLWWRGCPSWRDALELVRGIADEMGLDERAVLVEEIETDAEAEREGFVGSPTILVNGRDVQPPAEPEPPGLTCRVYRLRDGRVSPLPDPDDVRNAIRAALVG
jgi:hypothetical protein